MSNVGLPLEAAGVFYHECTKKQVHWSCQGSSSSRYGFCPKPIEKRSVYCSPFQDSDVIAMGLIKEIGSVVLLRSRESPRHGAHPETCALRER